MSQRVPPAWGTAGGERAAGDRPCPEATLPACSPALLPVPGPLPALSSCKPAYPSTSTLLCPPRLYLQLLDFRWGGHLLVFRLGPSPAAKLTVLIPLLALRPGVVVLADGGWAREFCPWGRARVTPALPPPNPDPSPPQPLPPTLPAQSWGPRSPKCPAAGMAAPGGPRAQGALSPSCSTPALPRPPARAQSELSLGVGTDPLPWGRGWGQPPEGSPMAALTLPNEPHSSQR